MALIKAMILAESQWGRAVLIKPPYAIRKRH